MNLEINPYTHPYTEDDPDVDALSDEEYDELVDSSQHHKSVLTYIPSTAKASDGNLLMWFHLQGKHNQKSHGHGGTGGGRGEANLVKIVDDLGHGKTVTVSESLAPRLIKHLADTNTMVNLEHINIDGERNANLFTKHATNRTRVEMPQLPTDSDGIARFSDFIKSKGITGNIEQVDPRSLSATQNELSSVKIGSMLKSFERSYEPDGLMFVSDDGFVIDGHHRWGASAILSIEKPGIRANILRFHAPITKLLPLCDEFAAKEGIAAKPITASEFGTEPKTPPPDARKPYIWFEGRWWLVYTDTLDGVPTRLEFPQPKSASEPLRWFHLQGKHDQKTHGSGKVWLGDRFSDADEATDSIPTIATIPSIVESEDRIKQALPGVKTVDLRAMSPAVATNVADAFVTAVDRFPELGNMISEIYYQPTSFFAQAPEWAVTTYDTYATPGNKNYHKSYIEFKGTNWEDNDVLVDEIRFKAREGWFSSEAQNARYVVNHELAHVFVNDVLYAHTYKEHDQRVADFTEWPSKHPVDTHNNISEYARRGGVHETFAESFAAYMNGSRHPYAVDAGRLIEAYYGKPKKPKSEPATQGRLFSEPLRWFHLAGKHDQKTHGNPGIWRGDGTIDVDSIDSTDDADAVIGSVLDSTRTTYVLDNSRDLKTSDLNGVDVYLAREVARAVVNTLREYPALANELVSIRYDRAKSYSRDDEGAYALTSAGSRITLHDDVGRTFWSIKETFDNTIRMLKDDAPTWYAPENWTVRGMIDHEFGHVAYNALRKLPGASRELAQWENTQVSDTRFSKYGQTANIFGTDMRENWAEAFAASRAGSNHPLATSAKALADKYLRR